MKKLLLFILFSFLISSLYLPEALDVKKEIVRMVMANGFIPIKQLMKVNGLQRKNKVKELRHGLMDTFIKVNLKIVNGVEGEF